MKAEAEASATLDEVLKLLFAETCAQRRPKLKPQRHIFIGAGRDRFHIRSTKAETETSATRHCIMKPT